MVTEFITMVAEYYYHGNGVYYHTLDHLGRYPRYPRILVFVAQVRRTSVASPC